MRLPTSGCISFGRSKPNSLVEHVGDAALAALRVDADDGFVGATDVHRVDGEVGDVPECVVPDLAASVHALLDRVLVRSPRRP
jgi:hypothetical protein